MLQKIMQERQKIFKYACSGMAALAVDNGLFYVLYTMVTLALLFSTVTAMLCGLAVSFIMNKFWVFQTQNNNAKHSSHRQALYSFMLFAVNNLFTYGFIRLATGAHVHASIAKLGATACIVCWNYVLYKKVIFLQSELVA